MNKYLILLLLSLNIYGYDAFGQLTIEACQEKAKSNYPQIKRYGLIEQSEAYNLSNAHKGYLPQFSLSAKASYQSDITEIPPIFGEAIGQLTGQVVNISSIPKDQYQIVAEVNQVIWDGGIIRSQKENIKAAGVVEKQQLEVDLYTLKDRVNQLFFGMLVINELLEQNVLFQKELQTNYEKVQAYIANGVANQSDADIIKVEQLKTNQHRTELVATQNSYKEMLSAMIGDATGMVDSLLKPSYQLPNEIEFSNNRPELKLFEAQVNYYSNQEQLIKLANLPKIGFFGQGGYGNPGLDMFKAGFTPFFIAGARLSWNFGGYYTKENNLNKLEINKQNVDVQKETFLYNTNLKISQVNNEIIKIQEQIQSDNEIILLRKRIKESAIVKVNNGTLTVTDLVREINAENAAILDKSLHEINLLLAIYNLKNTTNN